MIESIPAWTLLLPSILLLILILLVLRRDYGSRQANSRIESISSELRQINDLFLRPKMRGGMGERLLYQLLEDSIPAACWEQQYRFPTGSIVDAVIKLGSYLVPVDAKFPKEGAERFIHQPELKAKAQATREIRAHIDSIREKYIRPEDGTLQFALMYLPSELMYQVLFIEEPRVLYDYALASRVVPVSPSLFFSYLQTISYGLQGFAASERGNDIVRQVGQLNLDILECARLVEKSEQHARNLGNALNEARGRLQKLGDQLQRLTQL